MTRPRAFPLLLRALLAGSLVFGAWPAAAEDPKPADPPKEDPKPGDPPKEEPKPAAAPAPGAAEPVKLSDARAELQRLKDYLKNKKSDPEDIKGSLDAVLKAYQGLVPDDPAADAAAFEKEKEKFHADAEDLFLDALVSVKIKPNTETNERDDVNVRAAQALGKTRPKVVARLIASLEKIIDAKTHTAPTALYDEIMKSLALLNDHKVGLTFIEKDWIIYSNTPPQPDVIKAALDALVLFKDVPGARRLALVQAIVKTYPGVETAAETNKDAKDRAAKAVWDKIKASVIKALQELSGVPKDAKGAPLATVKEFQSWLRDNDNARKPPWSEPKPPPAPATPPPAGAGK